MARNLNNAAITAREADAIEAAILASPNQIDAIAARFRRSANTIRRLRWVRLQKVAQLTATPVPSNASEGA